MTTDDALGLDEIGAPERVCGVCSHAEGDHLERDFELAGTTVRRIYCEPCEDWHDFVPDPLAE